MQAAAEFHPEIDVIVLSVDGSPSAAERVVGPSDLRADRIEIGRRLARTTPRDGAAALLPEVARLALDTYAEVLIADSAVEIAGPLDELFLTRAEDLRVVPRLLAPLPVDDRHPDLTESHALGVHLPTLLAAGPGADDLLSWWSQASARHPASRGLLLDQLLSWLDSTTCLAADHGITPARRPTTPMSTIDTTSYDPDLPHLFIPGSRDRLSEQPELSAVLDQRRRAVGAAVHDPPDAATWLYANALRRHEILDEPEPPLPDSPRFRKWLREPHSRPDGLCRSVMELWHHRPDLQMAFPDPDLGPVHRRAFLEWVERDGTAQAGLDPEWVADLQPQHTEELVPGVDLAGYVDAELGVGEIARLLGQALEATERETSVQTIGGSANQRRSPVPEVGPRHPVEILCVNADRVASVISSRGRDRSIVRTVGVFFWETDAVTEAMIEGLHAVDEVWAGSRYVADSLEPHTDTAVHVVPVPIVAPTPSGDGRALLGVDADRPVVLFTFDFHSVAQRKNPHGLVEAFRQAIGPDDGPVLVLKSINGDRVPDELERLMWATRDRDDMRVLDGYRTPGEVSAMIAAADVYASLHRSEGFGLTIGHAMALGTPVVITEGSGPADFTDGTSATLVPAEIVSVGPGAAPYPVHGTWWEPDLAAAGEGIVRLLEDPERAALQAAAAREAVASRTLDHTAAFLQQRLRNQTFRKRWRR